MMRLPLAVLLSVFSALLYSQQIAPNVIQGEVVGITDGDTLTILMDRKQYKIRLAEIDTPERGQPYASRAQQALSELAFGKVIIADVQDVDRYGRYVARLYVDDLDINAELVKRGAAWVYRDYSTDDSFYDHENTARDNNLGLWGMPESQRVPPWDWRRGVRRAETPQIDTEITPDTTSNQNSNCHPSYSGCLDINASDYDCAGGRGNGPLYTSRVKVIGPDVFRLDGDNDGWGCE